MGRRQGLLAPLAVMLALLAAWAAIGFIVENSYYRLLLTIVPIWAVLAVSWNVFSGYSGLISFGHAAFFGLGAYTVTLALVQFGLTPWAGIPLAALVGGIAGAAIGYPTFRLRGVYFALAMLAYPLALIYVFDWLGYQEVSLPIKRDNPGWYMQFSDYRIYLLLALGLLAAALLVSLLIERSRFGLSLLAIKQNELAAEAAGIDTLAWKMRAIIISGALGGAAGGFYAIVLLVVTPQSVFGLVVSAQAMILTLFGGVGILWGPVIGAAVLVPLSESLHAELGHIMPGIQGIVYALAIILVILFAPEGVYWRVRDLVVRQEQARERVEAVAIASPRLASAHTPRSKLGATLLEVRGLCKAFGGLRAVRDVSLDIREGEILGIIGPNGAGKTTLFNVLNGIIPADCGEVRFGGKRLVGFKPNQVCRKGVGRTFQVVRAFPRMSVLENVVVGAYVAADTDTAAWKAANYALDAVGLTDRAEAVAGSLTSKELRLMELARALAGRPRLVLLDEPLAGLGAAETEEMIGLIRELPARGVTVAIIEHTMQAMVGLVDRFVVLDHGAVLAEGHPDLVTKDPAVIEAYLGRKWALGHAAH